MHILEEEMNIGLSSATYDQATVKMFPTYVRDIPSGREVGQILALDLGGTNFRIFLVNLNPDSRIKLTSKIFVVPQSIIMREGKHVCHSFIKASLLFLSI